MQKILVGLSGGVDSAVSAYLLKEQGYEVACGFMINYLDEENESCPTRVDLEEARRVALFLDLPFYTFDYREEYEKRIVDYIYSEYDTGRTPNPDVFCNNLIKFDLFLEEALSLGYDGIAMGHYARTTSSPALLLKEKGDLRAFSIGDEGNPPSLKEISEERSACTTILNLEQGRGLGGEVFLLKGIDPSKDQSYFLSRLSQYQLAHAIFPIGHLLKSEVREIAKKVGLPNANRKDSQGLCFIGKVSMKEFLERRFSKKPGNILDVSGKVIGTHEGAFSYTIGQRRGIAIGGGPALVVLAKDTKNNTITVGTEEEFSLFSHECTISDWIGDDIVVGKVYGAKIRYRQEDQKCTIVESEKGKIQSGTNSESGMFHVEFTLPQRAIASGQICVIYDGDRVVGSGVII